MFIPFEQMTENSTVWIYQLDRSITGTEKQVIETSIRKFCESWVAHGNGLQTSFDLRYDHFLILAVDEQLNGASGCSIDSSVHVLKSLEDQLQLSFFERLKPAFLDKGKVETFSLAQVKEKLQKGEMNAQTLTFNNLVTTVAEYKNRWVVPIGESWLAKHLPKSALA